MHFNFSLTVIHLNRGWGTAQKEEIAMYYVSHKNYYHFTGTRWEEISRGRFDALLDELGAICAESDEDTLTYVCPDNQALEIRYWYEEIDD